MKTFERENDLSLISRSPEKIDKQTQVSIGSSNNKIAVAYYSILFVQGKRSFP